MIIGTALFVLRGNLGRMLDRVNFTKLDIFGLKVEFEKVLDKIDFLVPTTETIEIGERTALSKSPPSVRARTTDAISEKLASATQVVEDGNDVYSPDLTILTAWARLEQKMRELSPGTLRLRPFGPNVPFPLGIVGRKLGLDDDEISALTELRNLRNQVAHNADLPVTVAEAGRFKAATERLLARMVGSDQTCSSSTKK